MSTITFNFEDLCAFFTSKLHHRLMVGLIDNRGSDWSVPQRDVHQPLVKIKEVGGDVIRQYYGFDQVHGDIFLDLYQGASPHVLSELTEDDGRRHPFNLLVDIEKTLYDGASLDVDAACCKARFHFRDGELYTRDRLFQVLFADLAGDVADDKQVPKAAIKCGLDVKVPDDAQAVLHFSNGAADFEFKKRRDYEVTITNRAENIRGDHFRFFYGILRQPPPFRLIPSQFTEIEARGIITQFDDPFCTIGGFGLAEFQPETPHFDW
jgi:hypothetical protein